MVLKGLFHPACLASVVSWFASVVAIFMAHKNGDTSVVTIFMAHKNGDKQRATKR